MTIKQSKQVDVYETAIVPDLEDAVRKLVDTPLNYQGNNASAGRATLAAAKSLLGRVYLTMAGYPVQDESKKALAEQLFSEVIDYARANNKRCIRDSSRSCGTDGWIRKQTRPTSSVIGTTRRIQ